LLPRGVDRPIPAADPDYAERLAVPWTLEQYAAQAAAARAADRGAHPSRIDGQSASGLCQVFGNLTPLGIAGTRLCAVLPGGRRAVRVELEALAGRADLYPLEVAVEVAGQPCGSMTIKAGAKVERTFELEAAPASPFEVRLIPERWCVLTQGERTGLGSFRFLTLEAVED
jgi:hypothetical protein